jgi:hypothetical protein
MRPVGTGYIDIITPVASSEAFLEALNTLGIAVNRITLWCHCTEGNALRFGCPHGHGGPLCRGGFYSEVCEQDSYEVAHPRPPGNDPSDLSRWVRECNDSAKQYVLSGMKRRQDYSPCFTPGFWLDVPEDWRNPWSSHA